VLESDIETGSRWVLSLDVLGTEPDMKLYIDDFSISCTKTVNVNPLDDEFDVAFTHGSGTTLNMPGFWDGGNTWRVRFAPTKIGEWTYITQFSDTEDSGLHHVKGTINCVPYEGELDIYKRGFIQADANKRYFTYADGTPFFYLGDTHWSMPGEPFETMFKAIVDNRAAKKFTVYQSEPIRAQYVLSRGFNESALIGFHDLDRRFQYIAEKGLVHANAQLFFASELGWHRASYPDKYLQQLSRYWVARYAAYPVMWTTAQEADRDFYATYRKEHNFFGPDDNPWKIVFNAIHKDDPYNHPQTAHQEYTGSTRVRDSSFKDLPGHDWFASQWSHALAHQLDFAAPKEYWDYGRITVNYEGKYENLWTKEFGARVQGWTAFLNGMFGYGYGAVDLWLHNSTYDIETTSNDGIDTITPADKNVKWDVSMNFATTDQLGHMRDFFEKIHWWELVPRFNDPAYGDLRGSFYSLATIGNATIGNDVYVCYFYNRTRTTGTLRGMEGNYIANFFNPRTGEYHLIGDVTPEDVTPENGEYTIPEKPDNEDWVLIVTRVRG